MPYPKLIAHFTYLSKGGVHDRKIQLIHTSRGRWNLKVQGIPELGRTLPNRRLAVIAFKHWWEKSWKDWGASDITWV